MVNYNKIVLFLYYYIAWRHESKAAAATVIHPVSLRSVSQSRIWEAFFWGLTF